MKLVSAPVVVYTKVDIHPTLAAHQMASYSHQDPNRRRDGSQASKAKSNKTIDY